MRFRPIPAFRTLAIAVAALSQTLPVHANRITSTLEVHLVENAGYAWTTVELDNSYTSPVIVCTYALPSAASNPAVTRINNVTSTSFDLRVQGFVDSSAVTPAGVHCIVSEEGAYTLPGGIAYEARTVFSDQISTHANNWPISAMEDVSADITQSYLAPILVGQVMSYNDNRASVFHANDCEQRANPAFQSGQADGACLGRHIGQIASTRAGETIGYFVIESGSGTTNGVTYVSGTTARSIRGVGNNPPYAVSLPADYEIGIAAMAGVQGGQGGWYVHYGADPLPASGLRAAIDEETVAGDATRRHTFERAFYWVFDETNFPELTLDKSAPTTSFDEAGETVTYTFDIENTGNVTVDAITLSDDKIGTVSCPATSLAAGASMSCSASYTITPADVSAGNATNIATVDGDPTGGSLSPATDTWTLTYTNGPTDLTVTKTNELWSANGYALPGEDVVYALTVTNEGAASPDADTLFLVDALPEEVELWGGDFDPGTPGTGPVVFDESGTGLTFTGPGTVGYSASASRPASMAECTYTPLAGYDPNVTFVCLNPQGTMPGADPDPWFEARFRVRLK